MHLSDSCRSRSGFDADAFDELTHMLEHTLLLCTFCQHTPQYNMSNMLPSYAVHTSSGHC